MSELAIRVDVYQPKLLEGQPTGLLEYVRQRTFADLKSQFENVLRAIPIKGWECSAYDAAEYLSFSEYKQDQDKHLPKGRLVVIARNGNCEGYRIELYIQRDDNIFMPIISAKYLSDRDSVWEVAKQVDEAIDNGLYGY